MLRAVGLLLLVVVQGSLLAAAVSESWMTAVPIGWLALCMVWILRDPSVRTVAWLVAGAALYELLFLPSFGVYLLAAVCAGFIGIRLAPRLSTEAQLRSMLVLALAVSGVFIGLSTLLYWLASTIFQQIPSFGLTMVSVLELLVTICSSAVAAVVMYWLYRFYDRSVSHTVRS